MKKTIYLITILLLFLAFSLAACGGDSGRQKISDDGAGQAQAASGESSGEMAGDPEAGQEKFVATCSACHGPEGKGIQGLGKDMTASEFIGSKSDQELVEFIKQGRDPSDPLNSTGVAMPPKGGNPALTDEDLYDIVSYIRTLRNE